MGTPEEQAKQPEALEVFKRIAMAAPPDRQSAAFAAIWSFWNFAHAWDDLLDGCGWPAEKKELAWKAMSEFTADLLINPYYREHAAEWRALFTSAVARNLDGDTMAASGNPARAALAPAVRCADVDIIVHFAYLAGGGDLMRQIGARRDYDPPDAPQPKKEGE